MSCLSAKRAFRSASSRTRRLSPRSETRTSTVPPRLIASASSRTLSSASHRLPDHDQPRNRRRCRVVLSDELLDHLALLAPAGVGHVEALALGEDAVANLEDLRVRGVVLRRDRDHVGVVERLPRHAPALHQRANRLQAVAVDGRALELLLAGCLLHLALEVALDVAVAAREEARDRVDVAAVLLAVDVADAGRLAALDVVVEARHPRAPAGLRPVAGAVLEELAEDLERLPRALGVRVRAEIEARRAVALAREVDARVLLVERDPDVGVRLVVAQADVEGRPVALDELLLGEERVGLRVRHQELDRRRPARSSRASWSCPRSARRPAF